MLQTNGVKLSNRSYFHRECVNVRLPQLPELTRVIVLHKSTVCCNAAAFPQLKIASYSLVVCAKNNKPCLILSRFMFRFCADRHAFSRVLLDLWRLFGLAVLVKSFMHFCHLSMMFLLQELCWSCMSVWTAAYPTKTSQSSGSIRTDLQTINNSFFYYKRKAYFIVQYN